MSGWKRVSRLAKRIRENQKALEQKAKVYRWSQAEKEDKDEEEVYVENFVMGLDLPPPPFAGTLVYPEVGSYPYDSTPHEGFCIWVSGVSEAMDIEALKSRKIGAVLNMAAAQCALAKMCSVNDYGDKRWQQARFDEGWYRQALQSSSPDGCVSYLTCAAEDRLGYPLFSHFEETLKFLEDAKERNVPALVHCMQGHNRSAAVVVNFLVASGLAESVVAACDTISQRRSQVLENRGFLKQLCEAFPDRVGLEVHEDPPEAQDLGEEPTAPLAGLFEIPAVVERNV